MKVVPTALLLLLLAAGCGGSGGASQADFTRDARSICGQTNDRIRALGTPQSFTDTLLYARQAEDAVGDELRQLRELTAPAALERRYDLYLATLEQRRGALNRVADAADRNSMGGLRKAGDEIAAIDKTARARARAIGIVECEPR